MIRAISQVLYDGLESGCLTVALRMKIKKRGGAQVMQSMKVGQSIESSMVGNYDKYRLKM